MIRSVLLTILAILSGCSATGPIYSRVQEIPDNYGVVYVYREDRPVNILIHPGITVDDVEYPALPGGGYLAFVLKEGEHVFNLILSTDYEGSAAIKVFVQKNTETYIQLTTYNGEKRFFRMDTASPEIASSKIKKCKLIDLKSGKRYSKSFFIDN